MSLKLIDVVDGGLEPYRRENKYETKSDAPKSDKATVSRAAVESGDVPIQAPSVVA